MKPVASAAMHVVHSIAVDDDVGFIRLHDRRVVALRVDRQHDMPAGHRSQVAHQSGHIVAGFEQHQATRPTEFLRGGSDSIGELVVRELLGVRQNRHPLAVAAQVVEDPAHVSTIPLPTTSILTLASMGGGLRLCWRTMSSAVSPAGSMVNSTSWPRNSVAVTVPTPSSRSLSETTVATSCSGRSTSVARPSAADRCTGMRPSAQSATPDATVQGSEMQSPRNSAVKRSVGCRYTCSGLPTCVKRPSRMTAT